MYSRNILLITRHTRKYGRNVLVQGCSTSRLPALIEIKFSGKVLFIICIDLRIDQLSDNSVIYNHG